MQHIQDAINSAMKKLKEGFDYGPGGEVVLTSEEACLVYRIITENLNG